MEVQSGIVERVRHFVILFSTNVNLSLIKTLVKGPPLYNIQRRTSSQIGFNSTLDSRLNELIWKAWRYVGIYGNNISIQRSQALVLLIFLFETLNLHLSRCIFFRMLKASFDHKKSNSNKGCLLFWYMVRNWWINLIRSSWITRSNCLIIDYISVLVHSWCYLVCFE